MINPSAMFGVDVDVKSWLRSVSAQSGSASRVAIEAYNQYVKAGKDGGWYEKIHRENWYLGDNLLTARIPQKIGSGFSIETNRNFIESDFSQSGGIVPNGTNKSFGTGCNPFNLHQLNKNTMIAFWAKTIPTATSYLIGCYNTDPFALAFTTGSPNSWGLYSYDFTDDAGAISIASTNPGLVLGVYDLTDNNAIINANGSEYTAANPTTGNLPNMALEVFATIDVSGPTVSDWTDAVGYGYAIGYGLTQPERVHFYQTLRQMMIDLGRTVV